MATVEVQTEDVLVAYADEKYKKLLREKNQYIWIDEYCAKRGIEWKHFEDYQSPRVLLSCVTELIRKAEITEHLLIFYRSDLMVDFEDVMQKIKDLSGRYNEEIEAEKEKQSVMRKQSKDAADIVKAKIKKLEAALTQDMPFQVEYPIGEITEDTSLPSGDRVFLIKTPKNKINVRVHNMKKREEQENSYLDADPEFLAMITDQKLDEFVNMVQEELKKSLPKWFNQNIVGTK